jgi:hypothetical protein
VIGERPDGVLALLNQALEQRSPGGISQAAEDGIGSVAHRVS